jgi:hypothetical protein
MIRLGRYLVGCSLLLLVVNPAYAEQRATLAVLELTDGGVGAQTARNLTDVVAATIADAGNFAVMTRAEMRRMLEIEQEKQILGCESDISCLAEVGGALGAALFVTGTVGRVGDSTLLSLALVDTFGARVRAREQRTIAAGTDLVAETRAAVRFLVRDLVAAEVGYLVIQASEPEVDVELDGHLIGITPLGRHRLAAGPHRLRLSKKGFVSWGRDIEVTRDETALVEARLIPSAEYITEHETRAGTWRLLAYASAGVGIAAVGFGVWGYHVYNAGRADELNRDVTAAGCDARAPSPTVDCVTAFGGRRDDIRRFDTVATAVGVGGAALLVAGAIAFLAGPTPGLYDDYRPAGAVVAPSDQGGSVTVWWRY